jgi:hypothetical protein
MSHRKASSTTKKPRSTGRVALILGAVILGLIATEMFLRVRENRREEQAIQARQQADLVQALEERLALAAMKSLPDSDLVKMRYLWTPAVADPATELAQVIDNLQGVRLDPTDEGPGQVVLADVALNRLDDLYRALQQRGEVEVKGDLLPDTGGRLPAQWLNTETSEAATDTTDGPTLADVTLDVPAFEPIPSLGDDSDDTSAEHEEDEEEEAETVLIEILLQKP